jgi:hypothetical protein
MSASVNDLQLHPAEVHSPAILKDLCRHLLLRSFCTTLTYALPGEFVRQDWTIEKGNTAGVVTVGMSEQDQTDLRGGNPCQRQVCLNICWAGGGIDQDNSLCCVNHTAIRTPFRVDKHNYTGRDLFHFHRLLPFRCVWLASAAGILRLTTQQPRCYNLTVTLQAGHDRQQFYFAKSYDVSARIFRIRCGRRSATCTGWADPLNASFTDSQFLLIRQNAYDGFLPMPQIQPLSYCSNICTSE